MTTRAAKRAKGHAGTSAPTLRAYTYRCFCGRQVRGVYPLTKGDNGRKVDDTKARCSKTRGAPANAKGVLTPKSVAVHEVGCGRTLKTSNEDFARVREMAVAA